MTKRPPSCDKQARSCQDAKARLVVLAGATYHIGIALDFLDQHNSARRAELCSAANCAAEISEAAIVLEQFGWEHFRWPCVR